MRLLLDAPAGSPTHGRGAIYAAEKVAFADVDGDGDEEFIYRRHTEDYPKTSLFKLARFEEGAVVEEWSTDREHSVGLAKTLVGNIDSDPESEVVLFDQAARGVRAKALRVYQWPDGRFTESGTNRFGGKVGSLLDIDGDGVKELLLGSNRTGFDDFHRTTLTIVRFTGDDWTEVHKLDLTNDLKAMTAGDIIGDGVDEIITEERSRDGTIKGQLAIYQVSPDGIRRVYAWNRFARKISFLRVFKSGDRPYLFTEWWRDWKGVLEVRQSPDGEYDAEFLRSYDPRIFRDALRTTMAYSRDSGHYVRTVDGDKAEWHTLEWLTPEQLNGESPSQ